MIDNPCGNPDSGCSAGDVLQNHCVGTDASMVADMHAAKYFSTCAEIYVSSDDRRSGLGAADANRHLLKDQTIGPDHGLRKDDNAVGMDQQKPTTDIAIQRNIGAGDDAPEAMLKHPVFAEPSGGDTALARLLIASDRSQQATPRVPEPMYNARGSNQEYLPKLFRSPAFNVSTSGTTTPSADAGRQIAEGLSDYFIDTLAKCLRNENAIELGLEDFQMIDRVDSANFNFVLNHAGPSRNLDRDSVLRDCRSRLTNRTLPEYGCGTVLSRGGDAHRRRPDLIYKICVCDLLHSIAQQPIGFAFLQSADLSNHPSRNLAPLHLLRSVR